MSDPGITSEALPRVLVVAMSRVNIADAHGIMFRSLFADWPKDKLAQIYSGGSTGDEGFFGAYYELTPADRKNGRLFSTLKLPTHNAARAGTTSGQAGEQRGASIRSRLKRSVGRWIIDSGVWELIFAPRLTDSLLRFVEEFRPDVIYCQGYNLAFSWLPLMLNRKLGIPLCFHTADDWPMNRYRTLPFSLLMRPIVKSAAAKLVKTAKMRIAFGPIMKQVYEARYGVKFQESVMLYDEAARFEGAQPLKLDDQGRKVILYCGALGFRWGSIVDVWEATQTLKPKGLECVVVVLAPSVPPDAAAAFAACDGIRVLPAVSHEELPRYLKGADVLLLPETQIPRDATRIQLAVSSKSHLYMFAGRPVLVYGSPMAGVVRYAQKSGWGLTVTRRSIPLLTEALEKLLTDQELVESLSKKAAQTAAENHDRTKVMPRFKAALSRCAFEP